jgi:hypothetical protein
MTALLNTWFHALDRLSERDRVAVFAALMAIVIGLDMMVVMPMRDQRKATVEAMAATAQGSAQALADAAALRQSESSGLEQRKQQVDKDLAAFGLNNGLKESLSFMLARTLRNQAVTIQSLQVQSVEQLTLDVPTNPAVAVAAADPASASAENQHPPLYRHRYELKLQSDLKSLAPTLDALEHDSRPLRVESVHLQALPSGAVEATVMLVTIGLEKTWLAL